jgi:hypothetical protein
VVTNRKVFKYVFGRLGMKKSIIESMVRLEIDEGIRPLIKQLWKHCYRTSNSCDGHGSRAYVMFTGGDGWFEKNAEKYGLSKVENKDCCNRKFQDEILEQGLDQKKFVDRGKACGYCGAGLNGNSIYRGIKIIL